MLAWHNAFCPGIPHQVPHEVVPAFLSAKLLLCLTWSLQRGFVAALLERWSVSDVGSPKHRPRTDWLSGRLAGWLSCDFFFFFLHSPQVHFLVTSVCLQAPPRRTVRSSRLRPGRGREWSRSGRSTAEAVKVLQAAARARHLVVAGRYRLLRLR